MNQPCALLRSTFFTCERSNNNWLRVAKTNLLSTAIESASQHTHTCIHCICATCLTPTSVVRILLSRSALCVLYRSFLLDNYIWFQCIRYWTMADMLPMYSYVLLTEVFGFSMHQYNCSWNFTRAEKYSLRTSTWILDKECHRTCICIYLLALRLFIMESIDPIA